MAQNGTIVGSPTYATASALSSTSSAASFGNAIVLNGTSQCITLPSNGAAVITANASFAVRLRFRTTSSSGLQILAGSYASGRSWWIGLNNGQLNASGGDSQTNLVPTTGAAMCADGNWHTCALSINGSTGVCTLSLDGAVLATQTVTSPSGGNDSTPRIGNYRNSYYFNGDVDEVEFYGDDHFSGSWTVPSTPTSNSATGIVALYHLDETTGATVALDSNSTPTPTPTGTFAAALSSGSYLSHADDASLRFGPGDWTVTGWFYSATSQGGAAAFLVGKEANGALEGGVYFSSAQLSCEMWKAGGGVASVTAPTTLTVNQWHWFAAWHDSTAATLNLQLDGGTPVSVSDGGTFATAATPFCLGTRLYDNSAFTGRLDAVGKWSRVLSSDELSVLYNSGSGRFFADLSTGQKTGLVAWWDLQEASGSRADSSGNGLTLTDNGGVTQAAGIAGAGGVVSPTPTPTPITAVAVALTAYSASSVTLAATVTGGTTPTYQWYRSPTPNWTVGSGTLVSGATTATFTDTSGTVNVPLYYKCVASDSATSSMATSLWCAGTKLGTVPTETFPATLDATALNILFIGDSIDQSYLTPNYVRSALEAQYPSVTFNIVNAGVSGSDTSQWVSGSSNLVNAKAAAVSAFGAPSPSNVVYVSCELGVNDARVSPPGVSQATFKANLQNMFADLLAWGAAKVVVNDFPMVRAEPPGNPYDTDAGAANALLNRQALDTLANGTTVVRGDPWAFALFGNHLDYFVEDNAGNGYVTWVHPDTAGLNVYGALRSVAMANAIASNSHSSSSSEIEFSSSSSSSSHSSLSSASSNSSSSSSSSSEQTIFTQGDIDAIVHGLLNATPPTVTGPATTVGEMIVLLYRRFFGPSSLTTTALTTYADNGTTPITTQAVVNSSAIQQVGGAQ